MDHRESPLNSIAIIGMGLIGASLAAACRDSYDHVTIMGVDVNAGSLQVALDKGWADSVCAPNDEALESFVRNGCDLVVVATPASVAADYFTKLAAWDYKGLVTDTASTKAVVCKAAEEILAYPHNYIPGHPMAGSEVNGIEGARSDLFKGAHWILCPDADTPAEFYTSLHEFLAGIGARVISLNREDHDRAVAVVSHVPHFVAASLVELACRHADDQQALFRLAAGGFKDSTRIAAGSPALWCGIAFDNKQALGEGLAEMEGILGQFRDALESNDRQALTALLDGSATARRNLPAAWVPSTDNLLEVRIPMEDRKGVVAEVTTIASQVGCNIRSIEIDHITEDTAVLSLILTDEGDVGKLSTSLLGAGFSLSFSPLTAKEHTHVQ